MKKKINAFFDKKDSLQFKYQNHSLLLEYLQQLIQYKETCEKQTAISLLSQFHRIIPLCPYDQFPLLASVLSSALPVGSGVVLQRVLKNVCRLSLSEKGFSIISILLSSVTEDPIRKDGVSQLEELILLGLNGHEDDKKKSLTLLHQLILSFKDTSSLLPFLTKVLDYLVSDVSYDSTTLLSQLSGMVTSLEVSIQYQLSVHCMENLRGVSEQQAYNYVFLLIELTRADSMVLLSFHYHLLNVILNDLSRYNSNQYLHALLLRFYSVLIPFVSLEPVFTPGTWLEQYWKEKEQERLEDKKQYELSSHRYFS